MFDEFSVIELVKANRRVLRCFVIVLVAYRLRLEDAIVVQVSILLRDLGVVDARAWDF